MDWFKLPIALDLDDGHELWRHSIPQPEYLMGWGAAHSPIVYQDLVIFNQFEEFGNACWHYHVTGQMIEQVFQQHYSDSRLAGYASATGSAGTIAASGLSLRGITTSR